VWPDSIAFDFGSGRWDGVIAHELAHLRRGDHWVGWLELLAGCVYWWNPLFWYVRLQLRENSELACDAAVVGALPSGRHDYAASLIELAAHSSRLIAPVPAMGIHRLKRQSFERRLTMILSERIPSRLSASAFSAITVLALAAVPGWTRAQSAVAPTNAPSAPKAPELPADPVTAASEDATQASPGSAVRYEALSPSSFSPVDSVVAVPSQATEESRIDNLEKKLQAIMDEIKAMRSTRTAWAGRNMNAMTRSVAPTAALPKRIEPSSLTSDVQTLTRATYRLSPNKAEAFAAFLRDHMKSPVEAKIDGDNLVVTAPPGAQATIEQFIALSEGIVRDQISYFATPNTTPVIESYPYRAKTLGRATTPRAPQAESKTETPKK
jgi:predicted metal-dependent hydrolase